MRPEFIRKKNTSLSLGLGVLQILFGIPLALVGGVGLIAMVSSMRGDGAGYYGGAVVLLILLAGGIVLLYNGIRTCTLIGNYQKIVAAMAGKNREKIVMLARVTGQKLTELVRDLRIMAQKGYFPRAYLDLNRRDFVLQRDNWPPPMLADGDVILREEVKPSRAPLLAMPAVWLIYVIFFPLTTWYHLAVMLALSFVALGFAARKTPPVHRIVEKKYTAPPPPVPVKIKTGNETLDELLTGAMTYTNELNALALSITNEKMTGPIAELLDISRQIFAFVEKTPEKARQIRQFMNYYLPTTIRLLQSYSEFSRQPLKGDNIREAMGKIEESMGGIVETFRRELDNLYRDKSEDIAVDIDVMLAMLRQQGISDDFAGQR